ncbi:MAG: GTPase HflX [Acidobacteria bacterium]|nr:GTPase HflX [Acidobacteriota bacterium]
MSPREKAILVGVDLWREPGRSTASEPPLAIDSAEVSLEELSVLAESAGAEVVSSTLQRRDAAEAATLIGSGKVKDLAEEAGAYQADVIIFDRDLTPTQLRNLERALPCKVLDRTQLILDIFARRARTREGQLQVELAQLNYMLPRLTGRGASMSRLGGGIGTRGPGETQLETDRRRISRRIKRIEEQLENVRSHRSVQRRQRQAVPLATVALAGYTNAGKSTLFNRLTSAGVLADARMFATLDPTVRHVVLPSHRRALLSDTVGFISNLPTALVKAFRATLEEVTEAALILHLADASSAEAARQTAHVNQVLQEIGAASTPQILVLTKTDKLAPDADLASLANRILGTHQTPWVGVSALHGGNLAQLLERIDQLLPVDRISTARFRFPLDAGSSRHLLHEYAKVLEERWNEDGCEVLAEVPASVLERLREHLL